MATLPDLNTGSIGFIAYWNVEDQGGLDGSQWDVDEVLSDGRINNYTLYDNGVEGSYTFPNGRDGSFRVKNDGWFITYIDRSNPGEGATATQNPDNARGEWDIAHDWTSTGTISGVNSNTMARGINSLQNNLVNSNGITFNWGDVGLYHYGYAADGATNVTLLCDRARANSGSYNTSTDTDLGSFIYTSDTTMHAAYSAASGNGASGAMYADVEGNVLFNTPTRGNNSYQASAYGAFDLIYRNYLQPPEAETNTKTEAKADYKANSDPDVSQTIVTVWG